MQKSQGSVIKEYIPMDGELGELANAPVVLAATSESVEVCVETSESVVGLVTVGKSDTELGLGATVGGENDSIGNLVVSVVAATMAMESLPAAVETERISGDAEVAVLSLRFPHNLPGELNLILGKNGSAYSVQDGKKNRHVLTVGCRALNNVIREIAQGEGLTLRQSTIADTNHYLQAKAEATGVQHDIWYRVATIPDGIEIDLGDVDHTRVRITAGKVDVVESGSNTLFVRNPAMQAMVRPASAGNLKLLKKYVNLDSVAFLLYTAWQSYTLAHPKVDASKYVILVLNGCEGSGKSNMSKLSIRIVDPRNIGVQTLPSNTKDLAIATQNAHLNCYDNVRGISPAMSDNLCIVATGGVIATRQLYTDAEQHVTRLHGAMLINGISSFVDQPDLAQRSLQLHLEPLKGETRKSEADMDREFEVDLPAIQRGLFDLIANVFEHLPKANVIKPTRMIQFSQWLAAMEMAHNAPPGVYQDVYCNALAQGQRDALMDNSLAAAVLELGESLQDSKWTGTPTDLLAVLNKMVSTTTQRSKAWPENAIALSKRLASLQTSLLSQAVSLELSRGKHRTVTISKVGGTANV